MPIDAARYTPTPAMIARECAKIRANWNDSIRKSRQTVHAVPWSLPDYGGVNVEDQGPARSTRNSCLTSLSK